MGERGFAEWFRTQYLTPPMDRWCVCDITSGCGTDNNPLESVNKVIKQSICFEKTPTNLSRSLNRSKYCMFWYQLKLRTDFWFGCCYLVSRLPDILKSHGWNEAYTHASWESSRCHKASKISHKKKIPEVNKLLSLVYSFMIQTIYNILRRLQFYEKPFRSEWTWYS